MNVAVTPVDGSSQEGVESQSAWPELCPACRARASDLDLFSAVLLNAGPGIMTAGMGVFQAEKSRCCLSSCLVELHCSRLQGLLRGPKDFPHEPAYPFSESFSAKSAYFRCVGLLVGLFLRVLVCESTRPEFIGFKA